MTDMDKTRETAQTRAPCCSGPSRCKPESARTILDRRYAKSEITKEQYEAMKRDLEAS